MTRAAPSVAPDDWHTVTPAIRWPRPRESTVRRRLKRAGIGRPRIRRYRDAWWCEGAGVTTASASPWCAWLGWALGVAYAADRGVE